MDFNEAIDEYLETTNFENTRVCIYSILRCRISQYLNDQFNMMENSGINPSHTIIAKLCGASPDTERKWFSGDSLPGLDDLTALSQIFGCKLNDLIIDPRDPDRGQDNGRPFCENTVRLYTKDIPSFKSTCAELTAKLRLRISSNLENQYNRMNSPRVIFNQAAIAKYCGVSSTTVSQWFKGCKRLPGIDDLAILSMIFNCSLYDLLEEPVELMPYIDPSSSLLKKRLKSIERYYYYHGDDVLYKVWNNVSLLPNNDILGENDNTESQNKSEDDYNVDEQKRALRQIQDLLKAIEQSPKTFEEIIAFLSGKEDENGDNNNKPLDDGTGDDKSKNADAKKGDSESSRC